MKIPPIYKITPETLDLIAKIDSQRQLFISYPIAKDITNKIERISLLKSSLFSARIEGNPLTLQELEVTSNQQKKTEIFNILKSLSFIRNHPVKKISKKYVLKLHSLVMDRIN